MNANHPYDLPPMPPPQPTEPSGRLGRSRTRRTWWLTALLALLVGAAWAVPLFFLLDAWFFTLPVWIIVMFTSSMICFIVGLRRPRAIAYGLGLLGSLPITVGLIVAGIALASLSR